MIRSALLSVLVLATASFCHAQEEGKDEKPQASTEPKGLPLELRIVGELAGWELDSRGDPATKFQEKIRAGEKSGQLVSATRVELELEIRNTGSSSIRIWVSGDATLLTFDLKGPGAMTADSKEPLNGTIAPQTVTIAPGKSHRIPFTSLAHGKRLKARHSYITEIGRYQLSATFKTGVSPAPSGSKGSSAGFGEVILKSAPIEFNVKRPS